MEIIKKMEVSGVSPIENLPTELKVKILEYLDGWDLAVVESVSSEWRALIRSSNLWQKLCFKMMKELPYVVKLKKLPPKGLNWNDLWSLWTMIQYNKLGFCGFFYSRDVNNLNKVFYAALPHRPLVKYYYNLEYPHSRYCLWQSDSDSDVEYSDYDGYSTDSDSSAYHDKEVTVGGPSLVERDGEPAESSGTVARSGPSLVEGGGVASTSTETATPTADAAPAEEKKLE